MTYGQLLISRNGSHEKKCSTWLLIGLQASLMERRELDSDGSWQEEPAKWTRRKAPLSILVQWLRLAVEATGAIVIAIGALMALYGFGWALALRRPES